MWLNLKRAVDPVELWRRRGYQWIEYCREKSIANSSDSPTSLTQYFQMVSLSPETLPCRRCIAPRPPTSLFCNRKECVSFDMVCVDKGSIEIKNHCLYFMWVGWQNRGCQFHILPFHQSSIQTYFGQTHVTLNTHSILRNDEAL